MRYFRRRLPHLHVLEAPVFLTCRLAGSLPEGRGFSERKESAGAEFVALDRMLDSGRWGPEHLGRPEIAAMVVDELGFGALELRQYELEGFVVMPNHLHLLVRPHVEVSVLMKRLKGVTARRANAALGRSGEAFWQAESFDRVVRDEAEFERVMRYIEMNPVRAGLVEEAGAYRFGHLFCGWGAGGIACAGLKSGAG